MVSLVDLLCATERERDEAARLFSTVENLRIEKIHCREAKKPSSVGSVFLGAEPPSFQGACFMQHFWSISSFKRQKNLSAVFLKTACLGARWFGGRMTIVEVESSAEPLRRARRPTVPYTDPGRRVLAESGVAFTRAAARSLALDCHLLSSTLPP